ncbi:PREDICTED: early activation antigen CD69-like [Poecilia mexicana]|uniref:Si:dkey-26c10.5 n=2 Tax=Poecilia TaxID=8080 RepID=A0A096M2Z4_POEFO|nr:PREDICTED: early activation antigen CD69-like [Poecilia formosa]XP_014840430.1 PREDICTED: early activation antigen CD69-like [Poecilia mexicana]
MEMQDIPKESPKSNEEEGAGEPMLKVVTEEEAEPDHYEELQSPSEDVYVEAEAFHPTVKSRTGKQDEGKPGLYRVLCLILTIICFILLILVFVLGVKLRAGSTVCPGNGRSGDQQSPTCSLEDCQSYYPNNHFNRLPCRQCASGWLTFGKSCFFLSTTRLTWSESQKNCSSSGGSLAIVSSQNVQNFLSKKGDLKYWIGLRHENSTWNWVNRRKLQQSYWTEAGHSGDCAYLNSDGPAEKNWDRASCQSTTYFICQLQF